MLNLENMYQGNGKFCMLTHDMVMELRWPFISVVVKLQTKKLSVIVSMDCIYELLLSCLMVTCFKVCQLKTKSC